MLRLPALALAVSLASAPVGAEVSVQPKADGRIDLTARSAPLSEVLDRLARQTGMKVVYEGTTPRQLVTITLVDRSPAEAVIAVLEGLGVNFALMGDQTGTRVQTLMISGTTPASGARPAATPSPARPSFQPAPPPPDSSEILDEGEELPVDVAPDPAMAPGEPPPPGNPAVDPGALPQGGGPGPPPQPPGPGPTVPVLQPFPTSPSPFSPSPFTPQPPAPQQPRAPQTPPTSP